MNFILTGGGTAGHVTPNITLIPMLQQYGLTIHYIGRESGMEKDLIEKIPGVIYHGISAGKLRRYHDIKNLSDPFRVVKGYAQAKKLMRQIKPVGVFSKGGFVSAPVVMAAHFYHIPVVIHESDMTPGLTTKLCIPSAVKACTSFESTAKLLGSKGVYTGTPIREALFNGNSLIERKKLGFDDKPVIMIMGGSLGASKINEAIRQIIPELTREFNVLHICGHGKIDKTVDVANYVQVEYLSDELPDAMALADIVISRAGSNSINEFAALKKPMLLIPLATGRGDQIINAEEFDRLGYSKTLLEADLTKESLLCEIKNLFDKRTTYIEAMEKSPLVNGADNVFAIIKENILHNKKSS